MKNLVIVVNVVQDNAEHLDLYKFAVSKAKAYAEKYQADFVCIHDTTAFPDYSPTWQRFEMFDAKYAQYDKILYVDNDLVLTSFAPNIFELMDCYDQDVFASIDYEHIPARKFTGYFNAGLLAFKRSWLDLWDQQSIAHNMGTWKNIAFFDQCCLNNMVKQTRDSYVNLGREWNSMSSKVFPSDYTYGIHYIHYHKHRFNVEDIAIFEQSMSSLTPKYNENVMNFPESWKKYNFTDLLTMENDFDRSKLEPEQVKND